MKTDSQIRRRLLHRGGPIAALAMVVFCWLAPAGHAQRLPTARLRNGSAVKQAFRSVVAEPRRATVRIRSGGKDAALGVVVDAAGFVLTKASQLGESLSCRFEDGRNLSARIVGIHHEYDLAMLKVDAEGLPAIEWSAGDDAAVGAWLATPGIGTDPVAVGVVSVARRRIPRQRAALGIRLAEDVGEPRIIWIFPASSAARAGLKVDDVITRVAGKAVKTRAALIKALLAFRPGDTLKLLIRRGDDEKELQATLGEYNATFSGRFNIQNRLGGRLSRRRTDFAAVMQHDTVLRPEDCGGVVVDLSGRAVGLNIARAGRIKTYAIPAAVVVTLLDDLKSGKLAPPKPAESDEPAPPPLPEGPEK
jgi:serine protease Do